MNTNDSIPTKPPVQSAESIVDAVLPFGGAGAAFLMMLGLMPFLAPVAAMMS